MQGNARLASGGLAEEIERLRAEPGEGDIAIGGATLATGMGDDRACRTTNDAAGSSLSSPEPSRAVVVTWIERHDEVIPVQLLQIEGGVLAGAVACGAREHRPVVERLRP